MFPYYISDRPWKIPRVNLLLIEGELPEEGTIDDNPTEGIIDEDYDPEDDSMIDEDYDPADYENEPEPQKETRWHYCGITKLSRLLNGLYNKCKEKTHFCDRCLYSFTRKDLLTKHKEDCCGINKNSVRIDMPQEGSYIVKAEFPARRNELQLLNKKTSPNAQYSIFFWLFSILLTVFLYFL